MNSIHENVRKEFSLKQTDPELLNQDGHPKLKMPLWKFKASQINKHLHAGESKWI